MNPLDEIRKILSGINRTKLPTRVAMKLGDALKLTHRPAVIASVRPHDALAAELKDVIEKYENATGLSPENIIVHRHACLDHRGSANPKAYRVDRVSFTLSVVPKSK